MSWELLVGPAVVAAVVSAFVAVVAMFVNRSTTLRTHEQKLEADRDAIERKVMADVSLAERKFRYDRALTDWKRKTELAEEILSDFYRARGIFANARTPFAFGGEGQSREKEEDEDEVVARRRDAIYAPFERLARENDFFSEMQAKKFRFMAHFGEPAGEPFLTFVRNQNMVRLATRALMYDESDLPREMRAEYQMYIGWTSDEADRVASELNEAVRQIEDICRPVITAPPE